MRKERRVKARHGVTQYYQRRSFKRTTSRQNLPRGDITVSSAPDSNANSSSDDDIEDGSYMPSPQARPHGKGLANASDNEATRKKRLRRKMRVIMELVVMMVTRRKKPLLWIKSTLPLTCTWEL
jgi:hypothetical protein